MKVEVHRISPDGEVVEAVSPLAPAQMDEVGVWFDKPVHLRLKLSVVNHRLVAMGSYDTRLTMECHRCLKRYEHPVDASGYIWEQPVRLSGDEIIDLTEGIREDILLSLPLKNLCSENCKGLCPGCGKDLNEGPCGCGSERSPGTFTEFDKLIGNEGDTP
ncbi:MAG: DUF177 domain-containing protein [Verrucomicrobia bacterium]|nr:DUF177 domain-containing protein [Verrucomicrobiota bacterium]